MRDRSLICGATHQWVSWGSTLVAYAGIEPTVRQSGEFCSTRNHMSKRGSPYLKHAIFLATSCCSSHDNPLNDYY